MGGYIRCGVEAYIVVWECANVASGIDTGALIVAAKVGVNGGAGHDGRGSGSGRGGAGGACG